MANAWFTRDIRTTAPESIRIELTGKMPDGVSAKDVILAVIATDYFKAGRAIGQVLEFCGDGVRSFDMDERATLTNMAVEAGGTSGFIAADDVTLDTLVSSRHLSRAKLAERVVTSDPDAEYAHRMSIDLSALEPMVATPGDPRNGIPVRKLAAEVPITIAYGGSCTGGKEADMDMYASVLRRAVNEGLTVKDGVRLFIQFGSQKIRAAAEAKGYIELFERAGAELINPSCGACINAGPGVSHGPADVTVSAINRNFPGRSGPGKVYLASPHVVAASAIAGRIVTPRELFSAG
jgi:3-isopropylmalate/(R)-2-methylmalate dehydratase large subunit